MKYGAPISSARSTLRLKSCNAPINRPSPLSRNQRAPLTAMSVQGGTNAANTIEAGGGSQSSFCADTNDVSGASLARLVLQIDAIAEKPGLGPWHGHVGREVKAT